MNSAIVAGAILVLVSWLLLISGVALVGLAPAAVTSRPSWCLATLRRAMWWGMVMSTVLVVAVSSWQPLRSPAAAVAVGLGSAALAVWGLAVVARRRGSQRLRAHRVSAWRVLVLGCLGAGVGYVAVAALGPVTNYDSGLYHLGAIRYAGDFAAIPGLANLYFPFGYANAEFPLAAVLGNGPWNGEGFRLLNGLLMAMGGVDLALRLTRRRLSVGTFVLIGGIAVAWLPMIALSDYWITSPTSDSAVLLLTIVAVAYLSDALSGRRRWEADAAVALILSFVLVALRPTMAAFCLAIIGVIAVWGWRSRGRDGRSGGARRSTAVLVGVVGFTGVCVVAARDYLLSGWLLYPLSILPFDVPWAASDPVEMRTATLGAARDPANLWDAAEGWDWVGAWVTALPRQWEAYVAAGLLVAAVTAVLIARPHGLPVKRMTLAMLPSAAAVLVWWVASPPAFRFIWGPLFTLAVIPIGWSGASLARSTRPGLLAGVRTPWIFAVGLSIAIIPVTVYSAAARLQIGSMTQARDWTVGPFSIPYVVSPIPVPPTEVQQLASGLSVLIPMESDQCWNVFPLCTAQLEPTVGLRGETLQQGFERSTQ